MPSNGWRQSSLKKLVALKRDEAVVADRAAAGGKKVARVAEATSWNSVGWWIALLIGMWALLIPLAHYYSANAVVAVSVVIVCCKMGHSTHIITAERRVWHFVLGVMLVITVGAGAVAFAFNQSCKTQVDASRLSQLDRIPSLESQLSQQSATNKRSTATVQSKQDKIEELEHLLLRQQQFQETNQTSFERADRFSVEIPFVTSDVESGIAWDANQNDRLSDTYTRLRAIAVAPSDLNQVQPYLARVLQYYALQAIFDTENPVQTFDASPQKGFVAHAPPPVDVPDAQAYTLTDWLIMTQGLPLRYSSVVPRETWMPKSLQVPAGTRITFLGPDTTTKSYRVVLSRLPEYSLTVFIMAGGNARGYPPPNFKPWPSLPGHPDNLTTYSFSISTRFRWAGDRDRGTEYDRWATDIFEGLRKRLAVE